MRSFPKIYIWAVIAWLSVASAFTVPNPHHHGVCEPIVHHSSRQDRFRLHVWGGKNNNNRNQYQNQIPQKPRSPLDPLFRPFNEAGDKLSNAFSNLLGGGKQQTRPAIPTRVGRPGAKKSYMKKVKTRNSNVGKIRPQAQPAAIYNSYAQPTPTPAPITTSSPYFQQQSTVNAPDSYFQQPQQQMQMQQQQMQMQPQQVTPPATAYTSYYQPPTISPRTATPSASNFQPSYMKPVSSPSFLGGLFNFGKNNKKPKKFAKKKVKMSNKNRRANPNFFNTNMPPTASPSKPMTYFAPTSPATSPALMNNGAVSTAQVANNIAAGSSMMTNINNNGASPQFPSNSNGVSPRFPNSNGVSPQFPTYTNDNGVNPQFPNYQNNNNGVNPQFPNYANNINGVNPPPQLSPQVYPPELAYDQTSQYGYNNNNNINNNSRSPQYGSNNYGVSPQFPAQASSRPGTGVYQDSYRMNGVNSPNPAPASFSPGGVLSDSSTIPIGAKLYGQRSNNSQPTRKTYLKKYKSRNNYSYNGGSSSSYDQRSYSPSSYRGGTSYSRSNYNSGSYGSSANGRPRSGNQLSSEAGPPRSIAPVTYGEDSRQRSNQSYIKKVKRSNNSYSNRPPASLGSSSTYVPGNYASYDYSINNGQNSYRRPPSGNQLSKEAGPPISIAPKNDDYYGKPTRSNGSYTGSYNGSYKPPSYIGVGGTRSSTNPSGNYGNTIYNPSSSQYPRGNNLPKESGLPNSIAPVPIGSEYDQRNSQAYSRPYNPQRSYMKKAKVASIRQPYYDSYGARPSYMNRQSPRNKSVNWSP